MGHGGGVRLEKRAAAVAAAGLAAGVLLGYWSGAVAGVLGALAGLVLGVAWQFASSWQGLADARRARLAAADTTFAPRVMEIPAAGARSTPEGGVARFLRPEAEVVGFWPRPELEDLAGWVAAGDRVGVRLVTGAGGSGKTRLARQLGDLAADLGWRSWWVPAGQEAEAVGEAARGGQPVLLIVDYAETRPGLPALLAAAGRTGDGPALRVLLLARSAGEWWQRLADSCPDEVSDLITGAGPVVLGPVAAGAGQEEVFAEALAAFADRLGVPCPAAGLRAAGRDAVVLVVHAAALLAVLDAGAGTGTGAAGAGGDVLQGLLAHERRYWQQSLAPRLPGGLDPDVIDRVVTAGFLVGAPDQDHAVRLLEVVPDLGDGRARGIVARWLADLYPALAGGGGAEWIGPLQPDLLTERLVTGVLARHPGLARGLLTGLGETRAERALTVLARAALTQPAVALPLIGQALESDPGRLLVPAITVAAATNPAVADLITRVHAAAELSPGTLIAMTEAIPYPTVALAALDAAVTRQVLDTLPPGAGPAERASRLNAHGTALSQIGRPAEALPVTREAVAAYRELAAASPDRHRPDLARSLSDLGVLLSELGRPAQALLVAEEAVAVYRELAAASPDWYRPGLAAALDNLGIWLSELGRPAEALPVTGEAVAIRRELAAASPDRYRPDLATALSNLGVRFSELGRPAEALPVTGEAVAIRRELAAASPDRYRPGFADALSNLGALLSELGRPAEALPVTREAVAIRRELAAASPDRYRPGLADALNNLGIRLSALGRPAEALPAAEKAVAVYRELAAASPDRYRPGLARSLSNLGVLLSELGRPAEALPVTREAVAIRRELAAASPDRYRPDLARSLSNLGSWLSALGRPAEALPVTREAVAAYRELAAASPDRHRPGLARSLTSLAEILDALERTAEAQQIRKDAAAS